MTTANLQVGINTAAAKESLRELKQWLASSVSTLAVSIDPQSIDRQIAGYFKQRTFKFRTDPSSFREIAAEVENYLSGGITKAFRNNSRELLWNHNQFRGSLKAALDGTFGQRERRLGWDRLGFENEVRAALVAATRDPVKLHVDTSGISNALAAQKITVGGLPQGQGVGLTQAAIDMMVNTIKGSLTPAADELGKAATAIAINAKQARLTQTLNGKTAASESVSSTDPNTGVRTTYRKSLDNPEAALSGINAQRGAAQAAEFGPNRSTMEAAAARLRAEVGRIEAQSSRETLRVRNRLRKQEAEAERAAAAFGPDRSVMEAAAARLRADVERIETQSSREVLRMRARLRKQEAEAERAAAAFGPDRSVLEAAAAKLRADVERIEAQSSREVLRMRARLRKQEAEAERAAAAFGPDRSVMEAAAARLRADMERIETQSSRETLRVRARLRKQEAEAERAAAAFGPNRAVFDASNAAARAEAEKAAREAAAFGPNRATFDASNAAARAQAQRAERELAAAQAAAQKGLEAELKKHAPAANSASDANRRLTTTLNDAHSASRGLAGALGMLWVTWGSTAPILAGAAIAASLRGIYEEGKRVEYQLAFIKGLSGSVLGQQEVERATAGSMFVPKDSLDGLRALTQSGLTARQALSALPEVLSLATVGETSVGEAAFAATGVLKAFNLQVDEMGRVIDVMAKSASMSNASVGDMMVSFKYASAASSLYNVSLEETGAALAALSEKNIKGSMAGTAHMNLLREIYTPTKKASEAFKALGLDLEDMQRRGLSSVDMIDQIRAATSRLDSTGLRAFTAAIGGERGTRELAPLLEGGTKKLREMQSELENSRGFTRSVMMELQNTVEGSSARMKQALTFALSGAFEDSRGAVQRFNDTLASGFASPQFKEFVDRMATGLVNLTRLIIDNADTIQRMIVAYLAIKSLSAVASVLDSLAVATFRQRDALVANLAVMPAFASGMLQRVGVVSAAEVAQAKLNQEMARAAAMSGGISAAAVAGTALTNTTGLLARALSFLAGPVGVTIGLLSTGAALWELFAAKQDLARDAQDRYTNSINTTNRVLDQELERLRQKRQLLENPGKTESQITIESQLQSQRRVVQERRDDLRTFLENSEGAERAALTEGNLRTSVKLAEDTLAELESKAARVAAETSAIDAITARNKLQDFVTATKGLLSDRLASANAADRVKVNAALATLGNLQNGLKAGLPGLQNNQQAEDLIRGLQPLKDAGGQAFRVPGTEEHKDALATLQEKEAGYRRQLKAVDAYYQAEEAILKAKESAKLITVEQFQARQEDSARSHMEARLRLAKTELSQIQTWAAGQGNLKPDDRKRLDTWVENAKAEVDNLNAKINESIELADIKVQGKLKAISDAGADARVEGILRDLKALREIEAAAGSFQPGVINRMGFEAGRSLYPQEYLGRLQTSGLSSDAAEALRRDRDAQRRQQFEAQLDARSNTSALNLRGVGARDESVKAAMQAYGEYEADISKFARMADQGQRALDDIMAQRETLQGQLAEAQTSQAALNISQEMGKLVEQADEVSKAVARARSEMEALRALQAVSAQRRGDAARENYEKQRTWEFGMLNFWREYTKAAGDSARMVNNVMGQTFTSMEQGLLQFVTTGKVNFKSFTLSVMADAARMTAAQGVKQLISMGVNLGMAYFGGGGGGSAYSSGAANGGNVVPGFDRVGEGFANGGVMTPYGRLPLNAYRNGGVAYRPQVAVFAEGRKPEAYVPLNDGRSIPVTVSGAGGGGGDVTVNTHVHIHGDGSTSVETDATGGDAAKLATMIEQQTRMIIQREKRAGGLLAPA